MPVIAEDAVVLLTSSTDNNNFGTGFIIAEDELSSYVVSCAHVVESIGDKLCITGLFAEVMAMGSVNGLDMALLKVAKLNKPCLNTFAFGIAESDIATSGYSGFENRQVKRLLNGKLGKANKVTDEKNPAQEFAFFDVTIKDDEFSKLAGGYSGSPLCNQAGAVIGVVSHRRNGEQGHAFCISNLKTLYADINKLVSSFKALGENSRLTNIINGLQARKSEIAIIHEALLQRLQQINNATDKPNNEDFLSICENFLKNTIPTNIFIACCQSQIAAVAPSDKRLNYQRLVKDLRDGNIALCLGIELQLNISSLAGRIAALTDFNYDQHALSEVCEYAELHENCKRRKVQTTLEQALNAVNINGIAPIYQLLGQLDQPFLAIATGFDCLLTDHLRNCGKRFVKIITDPSTQKEQERYQLYFTDQPYQTCSDEQLSSLRLMENNYSIVYYPRGYAQQDQGTLLLSERDYFNAGDLLNKRYPAYLHNKLKTRGLWFLGHHPDSWENRLLALGLQHQRSLNREKPLVIQPQADSFSKLFWQDMACQHDDNLSLDEFVRQLENAMT